MAVLNSTSHLHIQSDWCVFALYSGFFPHHNKYALFIFFNFLNTIFYLICFQLYELNLPNLLHNLLHNLLQNFLILSCFVLLLLLLLVFNVTVNKEVLLGN